MGGGNHFSGLPFARKKDPCLNIRSKWKKEALKKVFEAHSLIQKKDLTADLRALEIDPRNGNCIIVLSNYDPPAAETTARQIRGWMKDVKE